jgi:hypothetical protein
VYDLLPPLYPPPFLLLILPFLLLPAIAWWLIPITIVAAVAWWWRPAPWSWPLLAALVAWPRTFEIVLFGNPTMWVATAVALGTLTGGPAVAVLLKPSLAPFALVGIRSRSWWGALALFAGVCLAFGSMWIDYAAALANADQDWTYSLRDYPFLLLPLVSWVARQRSERPTPVRAARHVALPVQA